MGRQQLEAFYKKMAENKDLKDQVTAIKGDIDTVYEEIVNIARANGFDNWTLSPADALQFATAYAVCF